MKLSGISSYLISPLPVTTEYTCILLELGSLFSLPRPPCKLPCPNEAVGLGGSPAQKEWVWNS